MTLAPGMRLGSFEIVSPIGAGGMGEVYRARDTKLGRDVAVKVLPAELARDRERLERFEREARMLAQLNHVNVATLHGLEEHEGQMFLVMELVEGETLADRIARGRLPVDEAIPLFVQIAEGLEAAHEKDIIHRDLKPANISIGRDGKPKILDFGLAKAFIRDEGTAAVSSQSPTLSQGTATGVILGTASYMSPEQARGLSVDKRTDIWAFGCCFYEALTGRRAFDGDNVTDVLSAIVGQEPDLSPVPEELRGFVARCLSKDARERLRDIGDGRIELTRGKSTRFAASTHERSRRWLAIPLLAALLAGFAVGWAFRPAPDPPSYVRHFNLRMPVARIDGAPAISPNGSAVALVSDGRFYLLRLDARETVEDAPLPWFQDSDIRPRPKAPFFSPDGEWIGFIATTSGLEAGVGSAPSAVDNIYKVSVHGGEPIRVATVGLAGSATWGDDGRIYFSRNGGEGIYRVSPDGGGEPERVTQPESATHVQPELLPGGDGLLYVVLGPDNQPSHVEALSFASGETKNLVASASMPRFSPTGHLVFEQNGALVAAGFDAKRLELTGPPIRIVESLSRRYQYYGWGAVFSFSRRGDLVYRPATADARQVVWVDHEGNEEPAMVSSGEHITPTLSPDDRYLCTNDRGQLWVHDLENGTKVRVTRIGASYQGVWTPDGRRLIFSSPRDGRLNLFWQPVDGSGPAEALTTSDETQYPNNVSSDGVLSFYESSGRGSLWTLDLDGSEPPKRFIDDPQSVEGGGKLSPDGKWMAYQSNETGRTEIYVRPHPGPGPRLVVSIDGGSIPTWSRDGTELFYFSGNAMRAVRIENEPELRVYDRRELFRGSYYLAGGYDFDVARDGRFIVVKDLSEALSPDELVLVEGWFQELERRVPSGD